MPIKNQDEVSSAKGTARARVASFSKGGTTRSALTQARRARTKSTSTKPTTRRQSCPENQVVWDVLRYSVKSPRGAAPRWDKSRVGTVSSQRIPQNPDPEIESHQQWMVNTSDHEQIWSYRTRENQEARSSSLFGKDDGTTINGKVLFFPKSSADGDVVERRIEDDTETLTVLPNQAVLFVYRSEEMHRRATESVCVSLDEEKATCD